MLKPGDVVTHTDGRIGRYGVSPLGPFIRYDDATILVRGPMPWGGWSPAVVLPQPPEGFEYIATPTAWVEGQTQRDRIEPEESAEPVVVDLMAKLERSLADAKAARTRPQTNPEEGERINPEDGEQ